MPTSRNYIPDLLEIFEEGGKTGELKPGLNPRLARDIFVGTMGHIITSWLLKDLSYSIGCQCTMCGGNVQPLCVEICPDHAVRVQDGRPVVTEFLCEDCNECGGIRADRAISVPVEKVTFYPAVENTHQAVSQGAAFGKAQPTLHRRLL